MNTNKRLIDDMLIEEEVRRIHPEAVRGQQSTVVNDDMQQWAIQSGIWASASYSYDDIVSAYAASRGWTQDNFTGMEIV